MLGLIANSTMCSPILTGSHKDHSEITDLKKKKGGREKGRKKGREGGRKWLEHALIPGPQQKATC